MLGLVFRLASDDAFASWSSTNVARLSGTSSTELTLQCVGNAFCWTGTLTTTALVFLPGVNDMRAGNSHRLLGPGLCGLLGILLLLLTDTTLSTAPPFNGAVVTLLLLSFATLAMRSHESVALGSGTLVLIGQKGWFLIQQIFLSSLEGDHRPGTRAGFALSWLSLMATACILDVDLHQETPSDPVTRLQPAVQKARLTSRILFISCGVLVFVGFVLSLLSISMSDAPSASASSDTFEVITIALVYSACAIWTFHHRRRGIILILMGKFCSVDNMTCCSYSGTGTGVMFELAHGGGFLSLSTINQVRVASESPASKSREKEQMQVAGSILLWVGTMLSTAVVWAPNDSNIATRAQELRFPFLGSVLGVILLWVGDNTIESSIPFEAATVTILLLVYSMLALVGQERLALSSGTLCLAGASGWFVIQWLFDAEGTDDGHDLTRVGFVVCWLSILGSVSVLFRDGNSHRVSERRSVRTGTTIDELNVVLKEFGVNPALKFEPVAEHGVVRLTHTKISLGFIYLGTWSIALKGLTERAQNACRRGSLSQLLGDLTVLSKHEFVKWEVSLEKNVFEATIEFKPPTP